MKTEDSSNESFSKSKQTDKSPNNSRPCIPKKLNVFILILILVNLL